MVFGTLSAGLSRISRGRSHVNSAIGRGEEGEARTYVLVLVELAIESKIGITSVFLTVDQKAGYSSYVHKCSGPHATRPQVTYAIWVLTTTIVNDTRKSHVTEIPLPANRRVPLRWVPYGVPVLTT